MASNIVLDHIEKFPCGPGGHNFADGVACGACGKSETPHLTCLFCELDGVERYGGICDEHIVQNGDRSATGPICGNCHVVVYDADRDSGGWVIMKDGAPLLA